MIDFRNTLKQFNEFLLLVADVIDVAMERGGSDFYDDTLIDYSDKACLLRFGIYEDMLLSTI